MYTGRQQKIVIHDDFDNLFTGLAVEDDHAARLGRAAAVQLGTEADMISLLAALPETAQYFPAQAGEFFGTHKEGGIDFYAIERRLAEAGVDPFGIVLRTLQKGGCTVLAKLRVSDWHHLAPGLEGHASRFWRDHPEWRIGAVEAGQGGETSFEGLPCIGPHYRGILVEHRGHLLDYAVAEVRQRRLAVVREFMGQYDVAGLTLNFIRDPMCLSFPEKNAPLLTDFVAECRKIVNDTAGRRGKGALIVGAIVPWQMDFCEVMGLDVEGWMKGGLLDYVSPTDGFVSDFNMAVEPWVKLASRSPRRCAVYPGIIGYRSYAYGKDGEDEFRSHVTHENVRALAHGFYAEGADGVSFFNFYSGMYNSLYPLSDLCLPERMEGKERHYAYMKWPLYQECSFLKLVLQPNSSARKTILCRLHEDLKRVDASVRFRARRLTNIASLRVDVNGAEVPVTSISLIPHKGEGSLRAEFALRDGMLRDGANEMGFALRDGCAGAHGDVIIQEVEIRVRPR